MSGSDTGVDRAELRAAARDMLDDLSGSEQVRARLAEPATDPLWSHLVEVGWTGIDVPEDSGGAGADFGDLAVVLVEGGRHLAPGTLFASAVLAGGALQANPSPASGRWLPALAEGTARGTAALADATGRVDAAGITARAEGSGWVLDGTSALVPSAEGADILILRARTPDDELLVAVPGDTAGLTITPAPMLDLTRSFADVTVTGLAVGPEAVLASGAEGAAAVAALLDRAAVAIAADSLGIADVVLSGTVEYVGQREQFDRPVGSFQAVKHRCTDMLVATETARLIVEEAADQPGDPISASRAKSYATDAAASVAAEAVQLHGGIGVTWEQDSHLYLKRATLNQALYGDPRSHRRRLADLTLTPAAVH
ncbi:acyl-CoA dehydrogenase family protein [Pseudonocardia sp. NPDC049154]|uniref:acyl-CoA dehydrogenase family protein n=1 Tax=Pseudonocardia sp. NPDC049154 TaxID=3155501 RepID=UPI0033E75D1A